MTGLIVVALYAMAIVVLVDAIRHDELAWADADRQRGWWLTMLGVSAVFAVPAVVFAPAYLVGVRPRFTSGSTEANPFAK